MKQKISLVRYQKTVTTTWKKLCYTFTIKECASGGNGWEVVLKNRTWRFSKSFTWNSEKYCSQLQPNPTADHRKHIWLQYLRNTVCFFVFSFEVVQHNTVFVVKSWTDSEGFHSKLIWRQNSNNLIAGTNVYSLTLLYRQKHSSQMPSDLKVERF